MINYYLKMINRKVLTVLLINILVSKIQKQYGNINIKAELTGKIAEGVSGFHVK